MTRLLLFDTTTERTYPLEVPDEFWSPDSPVDRYVFLKNIGEAYVLKPIESAAEQQLKQLTALDSEAHSSWTKRVCFYFFNAALVFEAVNDLEDMVAEVWLSDLLLD